MEQNKEKQAKDFSYKGKTALIKELKQLTKKVTLNEEDDIFLDQLNKKIRNLNKKLDQILELESKPHSELKEAQLEKINSKPQIQDEIDQQVQLKIIYYKAHEKAQESQSKDILKKSENSLVGIHVQKVTDEIFTELQQFLTVGKLLRSHQQSTQQLEIKDLETVNKIISLYERSVLLQYDPIQDENVEETQSANFLIQAGLQLKALITSQTPENLRIRQTIKEIFDKYHKTNQGLLAKDSVLLTPVNSQKKFNDHLFIESEKEVETIHESEERDEFEESQLSKKPESSKKSANTTSNQQPKEEPKKQDPIEDSQSPDSNKKPSTDKYGSERQPYEGDSENSSQQRSSNNNQNSRRNNNQRKFNQHSDDGGASNNNQNTNRKNNAGGGQKRVVYYYKKNFEDSLDESQKRKLDFNPSRRGVKNTQGFETDKDKF